MLIEYVDGLLLRLTELCTYEDYKTTLSTVTQPLASQYEHPDEDTILLFSRYKY